MGNGKKLVIYVDYDIEQHFENVRDVLTKEGTLSFFFIDGERGTDLKAQYNMEKILGFMYEI